MQNSIRKIFGLFVIVLVLLIPIETASASRRMESSLQQAATPLIDIDHEGGDLTEYTATFTDGGDLAAEPGAALVGSRYGLKVTLDDTKNIYAYHSLEKPSTSGVLRASIFVDPNGLSMIYGDEISFAYFIASDDITTVGSMQFYYMNGYYFRGAMLDDSNTHHHTHAVPLRDGPNRIDIRITRATSSTAKDGAYEVWVDGEVKTALRGIDNFDRFRDFQSVSLGANSSVNNVRGTYFLDQLQVFDDNNVPGPIDGIKTCSSGCNAYLPILIR